MGSRDRSRAGARVRPGRDAAREPAPAGLQLAAAGALAVLLAVTAPSALQLVRAQGGDPAESGRGRVFSAAGRAAADLARLQAAAPRGRGR